MKTVTVIVIVIVIVLGLGFLLFQQSNKPQGELPGVAFESQGAEHMPGCTPGSPAYNSNPPTSGCHDPQPAAWGSYSQTLSDQALIHNLEHGGIWVSYKPDIDSETVAKLNDFAKRYRKVVVEPRSANDANITLAAWGRLSKLDSYDEGAILRFIQAFYDKGPEKAG
ncbi:MAG: DUF3105 domain-containing protein [Candidatus Doudnabacteria bacterium]|nr:DUF3105 domain-containing protein [Candidatus Doudnabacteria bacterium]